MSGSVEIGGAGASLPRASLSRTGKWAGGLGMVGPLCFNGAALDKIIDMPPCDDKDPYAIPFDCRPYFEIGKDISSLSVQVTYSDGTQSPVREFRR